MTVFKSTISFSEASCVLRDKINLNTVILADSAIVILVIIFREEKRRAGRV